jgi:hypothetical protein
MTSNRKVSEATYKPWKWPVDLATYDRTPELSTTEREEIERAIQFLQRGYLRWDSASYPNLYRLLKPVHDVLGSVEARREVGRDTIHILLLEMDRKSTSYWAWQHDDWIDILGTSIRIFREHYHLPDVCRQQLMIIGYLLQRFSDFYALGQCNLPTLAHKVFGQEQVEQAQMRLREELLRWGHATHPATVQLRRVLCAALLKNGSPYLEDLSHEILEVLRQGNIPEYLKAGIFRISRVLAFKGILNKPLSYAPRADKHYGNHDPLEDVPPVWATWCQRWRDTSTVAPRTRIRIYYTLLKGGRWLAQVHPEVIEPAQWTRELAAEYVAMVDRMTVGQWAKADKTHPQKIGHPVAARTKNAHLSAMRTFFQDCQEWNWIPPHFSPRRCFSTPRSIRALIAPDPRIISDDVWAKLLWSGLNLTDADLPRSTFQAGSAKDKRNPWYPLEMVRAMVIVWLFAGLRSDEFRRLRVGCIRWQREDVPIHGSNEVLSKDAVCFLEVPVNKTGAAFTKAVDRVVGEAVEAWERVRPQQPAAVDPKTSEAAHYLFSHRGMQVGIKYLNDSLIPLLCRKGGIPKRVARGDITSHRARSTIASQLFNAKEPLSLFDLQEWLGHRFLSSTQSYAKKSPTKVAKSYERAGYFERNLRTIAVLIDQDVVKSGAAASGEPWRFYDLGHGYCLYEFFDQCPHRMACAQCSFYQPKGSSQAQLLEGKANLLHMLQEIPLTEEERAAVEDGVAAMEKLCQQLSDIPTPAGPTPKQLTSEQQGLKTVIPVEKVRRKR